MKLEDQVCSLDLAKKLKELGVKQEGLFNWWDIPESLHPSGKFVVGPRCENENWRPIYTDNFSQDMRRHGHKLEDHRFTAFTVAELGEMLPNNIVIARLSNGIWHVEWEQIYDGKICPMGLSLVNQCGRMLIHLIEKGVVKP